MPRRSRFSSSARATSPATRRTSPNPSGLHFLRSRTVARELVRAADLTSSSLVLEFGAGSGALTEVLAASGARVLAIERDDVFVRQLQRRFREQPSVRVVAGDLRTVPLPRRPFTVVANLPFSVSTALFRRLLGDGDTALRSAEVLTEWGFAKRVSAACPRDLEQAWWAARFDLTVAARVDPGAFAPRRRSPPRGCRSGGRTGSTRRSNGPCGRCCGPRTPGRTSRRARS